MNRKRAKLLIRLLVLFGVLIVAAVVTIILIRNRMVEAQNLADTYASQIESNMRTVYVVKDVDLDGNPLDGIKAGDIITDEGVNANVELQTIASGLDDSLYIDAENIGDKALIDIEAGAPVMKNEVTKTIVTDDTRDYEVLVADLMVDQYVNDYVDVRIQYSNGEDYLVLAKKPVNAMVKENSIFYTYLTEEEILRLSSATVDAYLDTGAKIYTVRYVEPTLQDDGIPNYLCKAETLDLLASDPNILSLAQQTMNLAARKSLESRIGTLSGSPMSEDQLDLVVNGKNTEEKNRTSSIGNVTVKNADTSASANTTVDRSSETKVTDKSSASSSSASVVSDYSSADVEEDSAVTEDEADTTEEESESTSPLDVEASTTTPAEADTQSISELLGE